LIRVGTTDALALAVSVTRHAWLIPIGDLVTRAASRGTVGPHVLGAPTPRHIKHSHGVQVSTSCACLMTANSFCTTYEANRTAFPSAARPRLQLDPFPTYSRSSTTCTLTPRFSQGKRLMASRLAMAVTLFRKW